MFPFIEAPHWPRFHRIHSRNITFIVFPLMLVELLTSLQLFIEQATVNHSIFLGCSLVSWLVTIAVFIPLHNRVANRPLPSLLANLARLNWIRTLIWTVTAATVFAELLSHENPAK